MNRLPFPVTAALALALALVSVPLPAQAGAVTTTFASLYFRRAVFGLDADAFNDLPYYAEQYGTSLSALDYTSERGSTGWFEASTAAGTLKAYSYAVNGVIGLYGGDEVWSTGYVSDHFTLSGPPVGTQVGITATFTVDGYFAGAASNAGAIEAFENAYIATQFIAGINNDQFSTWARSEAQMGDCWAYGCPGFFTPFSRSVSFPLIVTAGTPFDIYYSLDARAGWAYGGSGGTANFGSTGALSFLLPDGATISSSGGFAPTDSAVPEPSTLLLCCSALAVLAVRRHRRGSPLGGGQASQPVDSAPGRLP